MYSLYKMNGLMDFILLLSYWKRIMKYLFKDNSIHNRRNHRSKINNLIIRKEMNTNRVSMEEELINLIINNTLSLAVMKGKGMEKILVMMIVKRNLRANIIREEPRNRLRDKLAEEGKSLNLIQRWILMSKLNN